MFDRARKEETDASIEGRPTPEPPGPAAPFQQPFGVAMPCDPEAFRGRMEYTSMMTPPEQVFARPGFGHRAAATAGGHEALAPPAPSRAGILKTLA